MNVNSIGSNQQLQMQQMNGSGNAHKKGGENGMKAIMQNLEPQDRVALQEQLSSLNSDDKMAIKEQMKAIDGTNLSSDEYLQTLLNVINSSTNTTLENSSISIYA